MSHSKPEIEERVATVNQELFREMPTKDGQTHKSRRVTFRENLEEYEPENKILYWSASSEEIVEECDNKADTEIDAMVNELVIHEPTETEEIKLENNTLSLEENVAVESDYIEIGVNILEVRKPYPRPKKTTSSHLIPETADQKYKSCCSRKKGATKLPEYCGVVSEYGLTKRQLQLKQEYQERHKMHQRIIAYKDFKKAQQRSQRNEEAFALWTKNKLSQLPRNKYANRYDENINK